jgi:AraC family transcriptional regulator of adaptative response/methylated-DNA-[protein]-cysteine methyltransferase
MTIQFAITTCPLGRLLVAATSRGVCAVSLGDDDAGLEQSLRAEFPAATIERGRDALEESVAAVSRYLEGDGTLEAVTADLRGTAFQERVWSALRAIPYGETRSYKEVAAAIGRPSAARAVARACATNRAALVVPCHRVVASGGAVSGYRWGAARKRALLQQEARRKG